MRSMTGRPSTVSHLLCTLAATLALQAVGGEVAAQPVERLPGGLQLGEVLGSGAPVVFRDVTDKFLVPNDSGDRTQCLTFAEDGRYVWHLMAMPAVSNARKNGTFAGHLWTSDDEGRLIIVAGVVNGGAGTSGAIRHRGFAVVRFDNCDDPEPEVLWLRWDEEDGQLPEGEELARNWTAPLALTPAGMLHIPTQSGNVYGVDLNAPTAPGLLYSADGILGELYAEDLAKQYPWMKYEFGVDDIQAALNRAWVFGMIARPDGAIWLHLSQGFLGMAPNANWLVEYTPSSGAVRVLMSASDLYLTRYFDMFQTLPMFGGVLASVDGEHLILQLDANRNLVRHLLYKPGAPQTRIDGIFRGADDRYYVGGGVGRGEIRELTIDEDTFDLDKDGLSRARERELGLDDGNPDFDGDKILDGAEVDHFRTNPADSASAPSIASSEWIGLAPSSMIMDWPLAPRGGFIGAYGAHRGALCRSALFDAGVEFTNCVGPAGVELLATRQVRAPFFSVDFDWMWTLDGWVKPTGSSARGERSLWMEVLEERFQNMPSPIYPFAREFAYLEWDEVVYRMEETGEVFDVVRMDRVECPVAFTPADIVTRCTEGDELMPDFSRPTSIGADPDTRDLFVRMNHNQSGHQYHALARDHFSFVNNGYHGVPGLTHLRRIPGSDFFAAVSAHDEWGSAAMIVDTALRPVGISTPGPDGRRWPWFADGPLESRLWVYASKPFGAGGGFGANLGGAVYGNSGWPACEVAATPVFQQWVPVPRVIQPGEAIVWGGGFLAHGGHPCGSHPINFQPGSATGVHRDWALWRISREGGALRWLDATAFVELVKDDAVREPLVQRIRFSTPGNDFPLASFDDISVSAAGNRLCMVERENERIWEMEIDAGIPSAVQLSVDGGAPHACAYDARGELAWVGGKPLVAHLAGAPPVAIHNLHEGQRLLPLADDWLLVTSGGPFCIEDGVARSVARPMLDVALTPDGFATYLDPDGLLWTLEPETLCEGGADPPRESLLYTNSDRSVHATDTSLWDRAYSGTFDQPHFESGGSVYASTFLVGGADVQSVSLGVRPDGLVLIAVGEAARGIERQLWRVRPALAPAGSATSKFPELDHRRLIDVPEYRVMSPTLQRIGGMAMMPWSEPMDDFWRWHGVEMPTPDAPVDPETPDEPGAPEPPEEEPSKGCCSVLESDGDPGSTMLVLLALLAVARRRW